MLQGLITTIATLTTLSALAATSAKDVTILNLNDPQVQKKISEANWKAKDNWLNHLPRAQVQRMLGVQEIVNDDVQFGAHPVYSAFSSADTIDWRNKDGVNWLSPILNQGNCGSCVAFAAVATLESQINISALAPTLNIKLSPQALFSCGGGGCDTGWFPDSAAQQLKDQGVPDEACAPYLSGTTGQDLSCSTICRDNQRRSFRIRDYSTPTSYFKDLNAIKTALKKGPLMTTMRVYEDFMVYAGGVYKHTTGSMLGGHAVSLIGFDDAKRAFIIRNSWSEDWGDKGFAYISYDDISGIGGSTWAFDVPATPGYVNLQTPRFYEFVGGMSSLSGISTFSQTDKIVFNISNQQGIAMATTECQGSPCTAPFDSATLADGTYQITTTAIQAGQKLGTSRPATIYIINGRAQMQISFSAAPGTDLSKTVSGVAEFDINAPSSPVPMSSVVFHAKNSDGTVYTRASQMTLPKMRMGWRSSRAPNGPVEIWFTGHIKTAAGEQVVESSHQTISVRN